MKKTVIFVLLGLLLVAGAVFFVTKKPKTPTPTTTSTEDLPINAIPVDARPFVTMTPDTTGHYLSLVVDKMTSKVSTEYELVYNTTNNSQEGALGNFNFASESQPDTRKILLGTQSAGGAITYSQGVSSGSLTLTYDQTRLKENFNFLHFDPKSAKSQDFSTVDSYFTATIPAKAYKADTVVVTMKTFGLPAAVPAGKLVAGPYGYFVPSVPKGTVTAAVKLPAGTYQNLVAYEWKSGAWSKLTVKNADNTLTFTPSGNVFIVTEQ